MNSIASRLDQWLKDRGITSHQINKETGISKGNVSGWVNGKFEPSSKALLKLQDKYGLPINYIVSGDLSSLEESNLVNMYRELSENNKDIVSKFIRDLYEEQKKD